MTLLDDHFLSDANPIATADQRDLEELALRMTRTPEVQRARRLADLRWRMMVGPDVPEEAWDTYYEVLEEWVFNYCLKAANSDPNHPRVLSNIYAPPHEWFGMSLPGNRGFGGDNPDAIYAIVPVDSRARYEISGRRLDPPVCDVPFQTCSNPSLSATIDMVLWQDMEFAEDGSFVLTMGPEAGGPNHLRTGVDARYLLIRDMRADWTATPNAYRVRRLDPPTAPPLSFEDLVERAARFILDDVATVYLWLAMVARLEVNQVTQAFNTGSVGGMFTQWFAMGRLDLADDEAYLLTLGMGGAGYRGLVLMDFWQHSMQHGHRTSSLSHAQSEPDPDGTTTFVISRSDPGVHNWLDTVGLRQPRIMARWQVLPDGPERETPPMVSGRLVKLAELDGLLPVGTRRVTPEQRAAQLTERAAQFERRYADR